MSETDDPLRLILTTAAMADAEVMVTTLVEERLIACGNIVPGVVAIYRWEGAVCRDDEAMVWMETPRSRLAAARQRIVALHPYETPKLIVLTPEAVLPAFSQWARAATDPTRDR